MGVNKWDGSLGNQIHNGIFAWDKRLEVLRNNFVGSLNIHKLMSKQVLNSPI